MKKITLSLAAMLFLFSSAAVQAADPEPDTGVEIDLVFVSSYVFRGTDIFTNKAAQDGKQQGAHTGAPAFQPSITFATPVSGLSFNIWGSFAVTGREDADADGRLQSAAGATNTAFAGALVGGTLSSYTGSATDNFYKEANGLRTLDEIDFTLGYEAEGKGGTVGFGIIAYYNPTKASAHGAALTELYVTYGLPGEVPIISDLSFGMYLEMETSNMYLPISYSKDIGKTGLSVSATAGYQSKAGLQGWSNYDFGVAYKIGGFKIGFTYVIRPTLAFFDNDTGTKNATIDAALGTSTSKFSATDGYISDTAQTNSLTYDIISAADTTGTIAGLTPQYKLPKALWFVSVGYTLPLAP